MLSASERGVDVWNSQISWENKETTPLVTAATEKASELRGELNAVLNIMTTVKGGAGGRGEGRRIEGGGGARERGREEGSGRSDLEWSPPPPLYGLSQH